MKISIVHIALLTILTGCKSTPEKVKANKEKFIQVGQENSKPIVINHLSDLYEQAKSNNVEGKMKYLGVDSIQTVYGLDNRNGIKLDSVVIFTKRNYKIIYDFATIERTNEIIKNNSSLIYVEKIDDRLFIGKK